VLRVAGRRIEAVLECQVAMFVLMTPEGTGELRHRGLEGLDGTRVVRWCCAGQEAGLEHRRWLEAGLARASHRRWKGPESWRAGIYPGTPAYSTILSRASAHTLARNIAMAFERGG